MSAPTARRRVIVFLDVLILFLVILTATILDSGGGVLRIAGVRISAETAWRPILWLVLLVGIRLAVDRHSGPFLQTRAALAARFGLDQRVDTIVVPPYPEWREILLVAAALSLATAFVLHDQLRNFFDVPDFGDPLFSMWRMGWVAHQIVADPRHLFDANIFHPEPGTLTYSDSMVLPALTAAPLIWSGVHIAVAYNILFLSAFLLSGIAMYLLARGLGLSRGAAWIAGLTFGLCQFRIEHYSHLELQMAHWMPLTLLAAHRLLATGHLRFGVYLALALAAQWYSSMYFAVFLTIYAAVFISVLALAWRAGWRRWVTATVALAMAIVAALPLAREYKATEAVRGTRDARTVEHYSARPADYLAPHVRNVYRPSFPRSVSERELFPNFTPLILGAVGVLPPFNAPRLALLAAGLTAFDGSLGFNGHWYRWAYERVGPLKSMRVPARFAMLVHLSLAMFAGVGAGRLQRRFRSATVQRVVLALLSVAFIVESMPKHRLRTVWSGPPSLYAALGPEGGAVLFEFPIRPESEVENFVYIYFSTWHFTDTVNGYSGFTPKSYTELSERTAGFPLGDTVPYLQQRGVTHVSLHCGLWDEGACAITAARLAADARFRLVTATTWEGKPARLYELAK